MSRTFGFVTLPVAGFRPWPLGIGAIPCSIRVRLVRVPGPTLGIGAIPSWLVRVPGPFGIVPFLKRVPISILTWMFLQDF